MVLSYVSLPQVHISYVSAYNEFTETGQIGLKVREAGAVRDGTSGNSCANKKMRSSVATLTLGAATRTTATTGC